MADISVTFNNNTETTFVRGPWGFDGASPYARQSTVNVSPDAQMVGNSVQQMQVTAYTSEVEGPYNIYCTWIDTKTNMRFGVMVHVPLQAFSIGTAPYWYVSYDDAGSSGADPAWFLPAQDPSQSYTWPASVGYKIYASPTAEKSALTLMVTIDGSGG